MIRKAYNKLRVCTSKINFLGSSAAVCPENQKCSHFQNGILFSLKLPVHILGISGSNLGNSQKRKISIMENEENKEKGDNHDEVLTVFEDNPCWGSRTHHRLEDLLSIIDRNSSIPYDSPQYLVLNKPPDLRMDGQYAATVHKLLTYWYPPPSLSSLGEEESKVESSTEIKNSAEYKIDYINGSRSKLLFEAVSRLHQYNDVHDNFLRPCHQLDYATSGILLVAKTQKAAAHIGRLFEERHEGVQKSYIAIVVGDLRKRLLSSNNNKGIETEISNESSPKVPIWTEGKTTRDLREKLQRLEETYRRSRAAVGRQHCRERDASKSKNKTGKEKSSFTSGTFQGFQPAHSIFAKWKSKQKLKVSVENNMASGDHSLSPKKRQKRRKLKNNSASALLNDDDWQQIWEPVNKVIGETLVFDFEKLEWKQLHKQHHSLKHAIIRAADLHNNILRDAIEKKQQEEVEKDTEGDTTTNSRKELPVLFRLSENSEIADHRNPDYCEFSNTKADDSTFYVCCPLAQHPDQFNMVIPTNMGRKYPQLSTPQSFNTDCTKYKDSDVIDDTNSNLKFRPSLTKCTVLECGTLSVDRDNTETKIDVTKVRLHPMTGRRHQLRVHMALTGFPILGDAAYGGDRYVRRKRDQRNCEDKEEIEDDVCPRMCLHAQSLQLPTMPGESEPNWKIATSDPFVFGPDGKLHWN